MKFMRLSLKIATGAVLALLFALSPLLPAMPAPKASAESGTPVEMSFGVKDYNTGGMPQYSGSTSNPGYALTNCKGAVSPQPLNNDTMIHSFGSFNPFITSTNQSAAIPGMYIAGNSQNIDNYRRFYDANVGKQVPVIAFTHVAGGSGGSTQLCGGDYANARFVLIPVSSSNPDGIAPENSNVWVGLQTWYNAMQTNNYDYRWEGMRFTAASIEPANNRMVGTFEYFYSRTTSTGSGQMRRQVWDNFVIEGIPKTANQVSTGNINSVSFIDAANIEVKWRTPQGQDVTDTYTDSYWDDRHYFFLTKSTLEARNTLLTMSALNGDVKATPITSNTTSNKIPFIYLGSPPANLCLGSCNPPTATRLQQGVDQYANSVVLYDYNPDGSTAGSGTGGLPEAQNLTGVDKSRSKVWFYVSQANNAAAPVFTAGDGNEEQYIGTYALSDRANEYDYGDSACRRAILGVTPGSGVLPAKWTLRNINNNCLTDYSPAVNVDAVVDETKFSALMTATNNAGTLPSSSRVGNLTCDVVMTNPLTWFMCPIIYAATSAADQLDSSLNDMLSIDTDQYLTGKNGSGLITVMNNLRIIAFAIIVIAALIMVIAQASGIEVIDAYTTRKVVPGIVFAAIFIALWPPIGREIIKVGDVLGFGIRNLIYSPFGGQGGVHFTSGASSVMALLGSGVLVALGVFATFSFAISAVIAVATAFGILLIRLVIIIGLYVTAPVFIAFYPLPGTRKVYSFFISTFIGANMIFIVLAGAIAIARVFAWMMYKMNSNNVIFVLGAFFIYFGVYFFLGKIISVSSRTFANITGAASGLTRGLSGALQNYRGNTLKRRGAQMKQGNLYEGSKWVPGSRSLATAFNRTAMGLGTGWQGRFGLGDNARGRAAVAQTRSNAALELKRSADYQKIAENDDALMAATYADSASAYSALVARPGWGESRARNAVAAVQTSVGFGASQQLAAATSLADTGTGYTNLGQVAQTMARVARGNAGSLAFTVGYVNAKAKEKGNWHLAPGYGDLNEVSTDLMNGRAVSQARYDALTLQGLSTGADPGTIVRAGRQGLFEEFNEVHDRLNQASTDQRFATDYGANMEDIANMSQNVASRSEEFRAVNYGAVSIRNAAFVHNINAARQAAITPQRNELIQSGELRVSPYPYGGMMPGGPENNYMPPVPPPAPPAPPAGTTPGGPTRPPRGASRGPSVRRLPRRMRSRPPRT